MNALRITLATLALSCACGNTPEPVRELAAPSELKLEIVSDTSVKLSWKDNCSDESGYYVFVVPLTGSPAEPSDRLAADSISYTFEGLAEGESYRFGVQAWGPDHLMSKLVYCDESYTVPVPPEPDPNPIETISFSWSELSGLNLPSGVKVYKTSDKLAGRAFSAWYAIADPREVKLKVLYPGNGVTATIDKQAEDAADCLVLINGGIFSFKYSLPIGFAISDGIQTPWRVVEDDGQRIDREYWGADGKLHPVSRALFGVDRNGVPGVYWSFTPEYGKVYVYDQPIPSVAGESVQQPGSDTFPCTPASWVPYNALTCGPVLLKGGRCPINDKKTSRGFWKTNYELWADDIFGVEQLADRTAIGYTSDGKVILCICDGRISASQGATTMEMASIMKGLGCVGAIHP